MTAALGLNCLHGSHTTAGDTLQLHSLPHVHPGHLHFGFGHLTLLVCWVGSAST
jgi:hypothetical protein